MTLGTFAAINSRRTCPRLVEPGPSASELQEILTAAALAPDHGRCRPWRFLIVPPESRDDFGEILADAYRRRCRLAGRDVEPAQVQRERGKARRAPMVIVVVCEPTPNIKVPIHEQQAAVAAATQNLLLAATALGYGSKWATGPAAADPGVHDALDLTEHSSVMGFVHLGRDPDRAELRPGRVADISGVVRHWKRSDTSALSAVSVS